MPLQSFIDGQLPTIKAAWLNIVDVLATSVFASATTAAQARTAIDASSATALAASTGSTLVGTISAGAGAVARPVSDDLNDWISAMRYMTTAQIADVRANTATLDVTTAVNAAITYAISTHKALWFPAGTYLITSALTTISSQLLVRGDGRQATIILFRPTANAVCFTFSAGASQLINCYMRDISIKSDDTTHTKVAIDLYDLSTCEFCNIYIYGTGTGSPTAPYWSGANSIGIRTHGRDSTSVHDCEIVADLPVSIAANPNTLASIGEDMDHWHWYNMYCLGNGNYIFTVANGLGMTNSKWDGYQAWVGGTGGFFFNDTRVSPIVQSHDLSFENVRYEQCTDANGYLANITFVASSAPGAISFKNIFCSASSQGVKITLGARVNLESTTMATAAGKNALLFTPAAIDSVVQFTNCYWQPSSVVTLTGMLVSSLTAWDASLNAAPTTATWTFNTELYRNYWSSPPNTQTGATYSVIPTDTDIIANKAGTVTLTLEAASGVPGKRYTIRTIQNQTVVSAGSNVVPLVGGAAGTAILAGTAGKWAILVSDGTNWQIMAGN